MLIESITHSFAAPKERNVEIFRPAGAELLVTHVAKHSAAPARLRGNADLRRSENILSRVRVTHKTHSFDYLHPSRI